MAKIYQFPDQRNNKKPTGQAMYTDEQMFLKNVITVLIDGYTKKIGEIEEYKKDLKEMDGIPVKNPKDLTKLVKELNKMFYKYGISTNYYRFVTHQNIEVLYFTDRKLVYVYEEDKVDEARSLSIGDFINEFEYYKFTLMLDEEAYKILDKQIEELTITIKTLNNTKI
ncbi:MAG: hypothetical protein AB9856_11240 [Cellulosilyticaceae bacterium]